MFIEANITNAELTARVGICPPLQFNVLKAYTQTYNKVKASCYYMQWVTVPNLLKLVVIDVEADTEDTAATPLPIHCLLSLDKRKGNSVPMNTLTVSL